MFVSDSLGQGSVADYGRAESYASRTADCVFADSVVPHWFGNDDSRFWYRISTAPNAHRFILVDCKAATRADAFDHDRLSILLATATAAEPRPDQLDLQSLRFSDDGSKCSFRFADKSWTFGLPAGPLNEESSRTRR